MTAFDITLLMHLLLLHKLYSFIDTQADVYIAAFAILSFHLHAIVSEPLVTFHLSTWSCIKRTWPSFVRSMSCCSIAFDILSYDPHSVV